MKKISKVIGISLSSIMLFSLSACTDEEEYMEDGITVVFNYNDGISRPYTLYMSDEENISNPPAEPIREGYTFAYWQTAENGGSKIEFPYAPTTDTVLYAHWDAQICTVTFDYNYSGSTPEVKEIEYDCAVDAPETPERGGGYTFYYWQTAEDGGNRVTFPYTVKGDITFYARWASGDIITVTTDLNYDNAPDGSVFDLEQGESITSAQAGKPTRTGFTFKGWAISADSTDIISFPYVPETSVTLYAVWERVTYKVAFAYNYIDSPATFFTTLTTGGDDQFYGPEGVPEREGYQFDGWYTSATGGTKVEFPFVATRSSNYYAHWVSNPVTTNIFDAEFTAIDPNEKFYGFSSETTGTGIILQDNSAHTEDYPTNSVLSTHIGHYVSYLTRQGKKLTFVINSTSAVSNVTLKACLNVKSEYASTLAIGSSGENACQFYVNGTALTYSITVNNSFAEYTISTNVSLKEGENIIEFVIDNNNEAFGGGIIGSAPQVDYIKLENVGNAVLSWSPVYDNIYKK